MNLEAGTLRSDIVPNDPLSRLKQLQDDVIAFFTERGIETQDDAQLSRLRRFAHFWLLVVKNFIRNRCPVRASALAYTTLLALIPLLAVGVSVTTSLLKKQGDAPIRQLIDKLVANVAPALNLETKAGGDESQARREEVVQQISGFIQNINSGTLGVTSSIALIFVAIGLLRTIEATFNDIWGVTRGRGWVASITQYWAAVTLGPVVLVLVLGLTSAPGFQQTTVWFTRWPIVAAILFTLMPYALLSLAFAGLYQLMPNTRVEWRAALVGGIVGGCLWQLNNKLSVLYVSNVVTNSKIYGSLGIIPLFLAGLYFSWLILLFGAQVAYAYQNRQAYLQEKRVGAITQHGREFVALRVMTHLAGAFQRGEPAPGVVALGHALAVPTRLVTQLLQVLLQNKLVVEVLDHETGYAPARPPEQITAHDVLLALRAGRGTELATKDEPARARVRGEFARIQEAERQLAAGVTLRALADEAE